MTITSKTDIKDYIQFYPEDKLNQLNVITLNINGSEKSFLLGKSHNLYEDDNIRNDLVGKIHKFNEDGTLDVYWTQDYSQVLDV